MNKEMINQAFMGLAETKENYQTVQKNLIEANFELDIKKSKLLSAGIEGKNAAEREANLNKALSDDLEKIHLLERNVNAQKLIFELAELEVKRIRYLLWLEDVSSRTQSVEN